jgi:hypothetical protein
MTRKQDKDKLNDARQRAKNNPDPFVLSEPVKAQIATKTRGKQTFK